MALAEGSKALLVRNNWRFDPGSLWNHPDVAKVPKLW